MLPNNFIIVPSRGGSKGIENKNLMKVKNKALTVRSMIHAMHISPKENIILSTDSEKIVKEVADFFGIKSYSLKLNDLIEFGPFRIHFRDSQLSADESLISEVIYAIRSLLISSGEKINVFCLLQPTSPFRSRAELNIIREIINKNGHINTSLVSACSVDDMHPARMYSLNSYGNLEELSGFSEYRYLRRQDLPPLFIRDGGFYLIGDTLASNKIPYNIDPLSFIRKFPWSINIDGETDLIVARNIESHELRDDPNEN